MPGTVTYADWSVQWKIPALKGGGMEISLAYFKGSKVLSRATQPFVLVPYHGNSPTFKDGLNPGACGQSVVYTAMRPTAANAPEWLLPPLTSQATNDDQYGAGPLNPGGAVMVEKIPATFTEPAKVAIWAKFQAYNYQYIQHWEFNADGSIDVKAGLGGKLYTPAGVGHIHNFYFRLDFDIVTSGSNLVQRFGHMGNLPGDDKWTDIKLETKETANPKQFTKWRVLNKTPKPNGQFRSYELLPGSDGAPDGVYSTADLWVVRYKDPVPLEDGSAVGCKDTVLETTYGTPKESVDGEDVVIWYCLRHHHQPRQLGEEKNVVPYEFIGFRLEPRDFLDDTLTGLYPTTPPSPL